MRCSVLWQLFQSKWVYFPKKTAQKKITLSSYILVSVLEEILQMETDFSIVHGIWQVLHKYLLEGGRCLVNMLCWVLGSTLGECFSHLTCKSILIELVWDGPEILHSSKLLALIELLLLVQTTLWVGTLLKAASCLVEWTLHCFSLFSKVL